MASWRLEPEVEPGSVGVDAGQLDRVAKLFEEGVADSKHCHGAEMAVYRAGRRVLDVGGGVARVRTDVPVRPDTLFVIFSSTKAVAGVAMLMLYERGRFHYDEPVIEYWPSFASAVPEKATITIRHVMSHRAGLPLGPDWLEAEHWGDREAIRRAMEELPLRWVPGARNGYHAMNYGHLSNELLQRIDGRDCGRFAAEEIFAPLGLEDFYLGLPEDPALEERVAWCYNRMNTDLSPVSTGVIGDGAMRAVVTAELQGQTESFEPDPARPEEVPEYRHPFNRPEVRRAVLPAAGGIATARALAGFYAPLALGGSAGGVQLLTPESIEFATTPTNRPTDTDAVIGFPMRWGLGFHMGLYGKGTGLRSFGHGGAGGQVGFADPDRGLAFAFVCNGLRRPDTFPWRFELQSMALAACRD